METSDKASVTVDLVNDFRAKTLLIMDDSNSTDAAKISLVSDNCVDLVTKFPHSTKDDRDFVSKNPWVPPTFLFAQSLVGNDDKSFPKVMRDDWHSRDAASLAIFESFKQVVDQLNYPGAHLEFDVNQPTKSLCTRILTYFRQFCTELSIENSSYIPHFTSMITKTAEIAESVIELCLDELRLGEDEEQDLDYWMTIMVEIMIGGTWLPLIEQNRIEEGDSEVQHDDFVGLSGDLKEIKERLLSETKQTDIIAITGMGGIGKTTLATRVYEDPEIMRHFHVRAWTAVSQNYQKRDVLVRLLQSTVQLSDEKTIKKSYEELGELLCKRLRGRRYLIVVDDIWSIDDWDEIRQWLPNDENCSRIILTSRLAEVCFCANPDHPPHRMNILNTEDSLRLLFNKALLKQNCPPELVPFGVKIAEKCQGLPIAIIVVAGHLSKMSMTEDSWENVAKRVGSLTDGTHDQYLDILSLSYDNLHENLKACFLYMGTFPKNSEIPVQN